MSTEEVLRSFVLISNFLQTMDLLKWSRVSETICSSSTIPEILIRTKSNSEIKTCILERSGIWPERFAERENSLNSPAEEMIFFEGLGFRFYRG